MRGVCRAGLSGGESHRHGRDQNEADHRGQRHLRGAAQRGDPAGRHRPVGKPGHALALAAAQRHRGAAL